VINLYLKDNIFVFEIVFSVTTRHEWVCSCDGIGMERRRRREPLAAQSIVALINREEPDASEGSVPINIICYLCIF